MLCLFTHLAPVVGSFAQREGLCGALIATVPMGRYFEVAWERKRAELTPEARAGTIFHIAAADAAGIPSPEGAHPQRQRAAPGYNDFAQGNMAAPELQQLSRE